MRANPLHRPYAPALPLVVAGMGMAVLPACQGPESGAKAFPPRPNVIFILADDLGYGELGCYGQEKIETPHLDALARGGMRFTQHYSGSPVSAPSRCVLLTGLHTGHAYIRGNDEMGDRGDVNSHAAMLADPYLEGQRPLPAGTYTLGHLMKEAGYTTAMVGKWGLGYPGSESVPSKMGFDYFYGYNCQRQAHTYFPPFLYENDERVFLRNRLQPPHQRLDPQADPTSAESYAPFIQTDYAPDLQFQKILEFVEGNRQKPFFLLWTTTIPHVSLQAPERWIAHYRQKFGPEEPYVGDAGYFPCQYPRATYAAMISYLDEQVGLLVERLKALGLYENTLLLFTSDNGPTFNGGTQTPWFDSAKPFKTERGWGKNSLHEGGIRVPLIAHFPGVIAPGTVSDHLCAFWDYLPTLRELAGLEASAASAPTDGISFVPALLGKPQAEHEDLYWEFDDRVALRWGPWKALLLPRTQEGAARPLQLFHLENDPREQEDVAAAQPQVVEEMLRRIHAAHTPSPVPRFMLEL